MTNQRDGALAENRKIHRKTFVVRVRAVQWVRDRELWSGTEQSEIKERGNMTSDIKNANLVTRIQSGDVSAQQEFIDKYKDPICRSIRLRLGGVKSQKRVHNHGQGNHDSRVESVFNASMIRFFERMDRGLLNIEDEKLVGYILTISMRILIDRERRRKTLVMEGGDTDMQLPDTQKGPEYEIETKDLATKIRSLISLLPEAERTVAEKMLGIQENEISSSTAGSRAAVRSKWCRLRKKIIQLLD